MQTAKRIGIATALVAALSVSGALAQDRVTLRMTGPDWLPISLMTDISKDFIAYAEEHLGYPVEIVVDPIPWGSYYERLAAALAAGAPHYDLFVSDSQWIGDFADSGHIMNLNGFIDVDPDLRAIVESIHPVLLNAYAAYPMGTETYWGFPQEADVQGFIVRTDLFGHDGEQTAFAAKYGYELPETYEDFADLDWVQTRDIADFFTRPSGEMLAGEELAGDFYGLALANSKGYDFVSMAWLQLLYNWGGAIWDPSTRQVEGILNSPEAVESFEFLLSLLPFQPPGAANFDLDGVNNAVAQGLVAMACNWLAVAPPVIEDPDFSKVTGRIMVVPPPGHDGRNMYNLGGQPFVVNSRTRHFAEAFEYIKWWFQDEQQWRFAKGGGLPSTKALINSEEFRLLRPWTRAFADVVPNQRDVWKHPAFFELLTVQQEELHAAVTGTQTAREALDKVARRQQEILDDWD